MKKTIFTGAGVALVTPFNDDFSINYSKLDELVEFHIENGTDAIIACGTTGEASTMSREEHLSVVERVVNRANGRIKVIAGSGSNDTMFAIGTSKGAQALGVDGLLIVTPYYNKTSQKGLIKHYNMIADSVDLPIIMYSVPGRTGVNILPSTCAELAKHPNIVAIKEASGNMAQVTEIASLCGDVLDIYSGCDEITVPIMSVGGIGVISVVSNILPREMHDMCALYLEGKTTEAAKLQFKLYNLCRDMMCDVNPIPVKTAMNLMGMNAGPLRMPLCETTDDKLAAIKNTMAKLSLI
ncbi:MAG: 4-hydroxy-tetrahydrodipicolinate synthase [Clostridia bacterium]|nr:4-hydroxy-tetrahydrodipicolinate synthase [Clostridia bacterium]